MAENSCGEPEKTAFLAARIYMLTRHPALPEEGGRLLKMREVSDAKETRRPGR